MEKIIASAIMVYPKDSEYPIVVCGKRHCDCLEVIWKNKLEVEKSKTVQGFWTDNGKFLNRYNATTLAIVNGQILPYSETLERMHKDMANNNGCLTKAYELFSEDLW